MTPSEIRCARSGDVRIAYKVIGDGRSISFSSAALSRTSSCSGKYPSGQTFHAALALSRLIMFDERSTGLSDRNVGISTLEERMDDIRSVMDDCGSQRAAHCLGCPMGAQ